MYTNYPQPLIIGTDLTGLLISNELSNAQIPHTLIGESPGNQLPRPGQIATPVGTIVFSKNYSELAHLSYAKRARIVYVDDYVLQLDFTHPLLIPLKPLLGPITGVPFRYPLNLDRIAIDNVLYEKAVNSPFCIHLQAQVVAVDYEVESDRIRGVRLEDGTFLPTSHVFDATGYERFIAQQLHLSSRCLGEPRKIVHAIFAAEGEGAVTVPPDADWYHHSAGVVRLYKREEQPEESIDGFAICVPLGNTVAIHTSTPASADHLSDETLLELAQSALGNYGINYPAHFPMCTQYAGAIREQYIYERAYGANWLLTGHAYASTLVTVGAHIDTSFAARHTAINFMKDPVKLGTMYQNYVDYFLAMQDIWDWGIAHDHGTVNRSQLDELLNRYVWVNSAQFFQSLRLQHFNTPLQPAVTVVNNVLNNQFLHDFPNLFGSVYRYNRSQIRGMR